jgi:hypothetical protein
MLTSISRNPGLATAPRSNVIGGACRWGACGVCNERDAADHGRHHFAVPSEMA